MQKAVKRGFALLAENYEIPVRIDEELITKIAYSCGGDVRKAMNAAELCYYACPVEEDESGSFRQITPEAVEQLSQKSSMRYDRDGDAHYDILSAYQKSIRGSDPNAAMHYLARLIEADDLPSICRRTLVIAAEDVGLAYPQAIVTVKACVDAALQLGFPEARIPLAEAVLLLCNMPKSNSAINAIDAALADLKAGKTGDIPPYLKDGHYDGAQKLGRAQGYQYPHSFPHHWVKQQYLPDELADVVYYEPGENKFEMQAQQYWEKVKK
jgi:putative ATPase